MHRQKVWELTNIRERNQRIKEIMTELDLKEKIWEPSLTVAEWPEMLLTVDDSEVTPRNIPRSIQYSTS